MWSKSLNQLLETFKLQFAQDETSIGTTHLTKIQIDTGDSEPVLQRPYPIAMKHYDWVRNEINKLLDAQVMSQQPFQLVSTYHCSTQGWWWKMPTHWLHGSEQSCTWKFVWPMSRVEDIFSKLNVAKYFSALNLHAGYHHISLNEDSIPKTAFTYPFGKYKYLNIPFGLAQVSAYFKELMNKVLKDLHFMLLPT